MKITTLAVAGAFALTGLGASVLPAAALPSLGVNYSSAPGSSLCNATSCVGGWQFTVNAPGITISALGVFDGAQGNPSNGGAVANLTNSETVDLFNAAGTVIATTTVGHGVGTQVGSWFAFNNLSAPLGLTPGTYIVAALQTQNDNSSFPSPLPTVGSGITFDQFEFCNSNGGNPPNNANGSCTLNTASFLTTVSATNGNLGGNIEYTVGLPVVSTPEPATLALLGGALVGLGALRRREKRQPTSR
jgi:hypothetical protein